MNGIRLNMNSAKRMLGTSPNIPISSGGPPAGRINSMKLVHNTHIVHNVAMMDLKAVEGLGTL